MRGRTQEGARHAPIRARSPLGVPPRHLRQRPNATAQLEPRDFLERVRSARPDGSKDGAHRNTRREADSRLPCVTRGHYPRLAVPVQRDCTRSPVMMPSGRVLPKPPESRGDEPRPAGTALAPPDGVTRPASWYGGEIRSCTSSSDTLSIACLYIRDPLTPSWPGLGAVTVHLISYGLWSMITPRLIKCTVTVTPRPMSMAMTRYRIDNV